MRTRRPGGVVVGAASYLNEKDNAMRKKILIAGGALAGATVAFLMAFIGIGAVTGDHTMGSVAYAQIPPNSGNHSPVWQHCGFYAEPVGDEHAVHSLEHGVVWITYQPDLPQEHVDLLRVMSEGDDEVLVSPYPNLPAPVVFSMWGRQVQLDVIDDSGLAQTLIEIRAGPDAPEPGGGCDGPNLWLSGGTGDPDS